MRSIRNWTVLLALTVISAWAAERIVVHRVELADPMGSDRGHMILSGDQLVFVDDTNPDNSFTIPRSDIRQLRYENGLLTMTLAHPFSGMYGDRPDVVMHVYDPGSPNLIASWVGLPVTSVGEASRVITEVPPQPPMESEALFNVRYHDDSGKLVITQTGVSFEDLSNANHSRSWSYAQIKELKREKSSNEIKIQPYNGDKFEFHVEGPFMTDTVYNMIADRIIAARGH